MIIILLLMTCIVKKMTKWNHERSFKIKEDYAMIKKNSPKERVNHR